MRLSVRLSLAGARSSETNMEEKKKVRINDNERKVLTVLDEVTDTWGERCLPFSWIIDGENLDLKAVRRACRSLRKKGLAEFHRGLMDEDGQVAGSGYCISKAGKAFMHPCDVCGDESTYSYDGKKECEQHYGKSTKAETLSLLK